MIYFLCVLLSLFSSIECSLTKHEKIEHRFLLITGCARSGTMFMSRLMLRSGIDAPHESMGGDGIVSWLMAVDAEKAPWGPGRHNYTFDHIFHQVRNPLKSVNSIYNSESNESWRYICKNMPEISMKADLLTRSVQYWVYWNLHIEKIAEWRYRIEDIDNVVDEMERRLGRPINKEQLKKISRNLNTRKKKETFTWAQIKEKIDPKLFRKFEKLAIRYGYKVGD